MSCEKGTDCKEVSSLPKLTDGARVAKELPGDDVFASFATPLTPGSGGGGGYYSVGGPGFGGKFPKAGRKGAKGNPGNGRVGSVTKENQRDLSTNPKIDKRKVKKEIGKKVRNAAETNSKKTPINPYPDKGPVQTSINVQDAKKLEQSIYVKKQVAGSNIDAAKYGKKGHTGAKSHKDEYKQFDKYQKQQEAKMKEFDTKHKAAKQELLKTKREFNKSLKKGSEK